MSNIDAPRGLTPIRHLNGSAWNGAMNVYWHSSTDSAAIFKGDMVIGSIKVGADGTGKYSQVEQCNDTGSPVVGVAWGFGNTPFIAANVSNLNAADYCPVSVTRYIFVVDDPSVIFQIQDSSVLAATDVGSNFDTTGYASGSTTTGRSAVELASSKTDSGATAQLRLLRMVPREDNSLLVNADWEVLINESAYKLDETSGWST